MAAFWPPFLFLGEQFAQCRSLFRSKRDSSAARADAFAGANAKRRRRLASVGMTGLVFARASESGQGSISGLNQRCRLEAGATKTDRSWEARATFWILRRIRS